MPSRDDAYLRHQQTRWLRQDAARWIRPDAARFLKPGTRVEDVYPALALKYSPHQPRVPAGNPDGGQWTDGSSSGRPRVTIYRTDPENNEPGDAESGESGLSVSWPMGSIDVGDIASEIDTLDLFGIKPRARDAGGVQLAGDPPAGMGDNGGPPLDEPPEIPASLPDTRKERTDFIRTAIRWIARAGRYSPAVDIFLGSLRQLDEFKALTDAIESANDLPRSLEDLKDRAEAPSDPRYQNHHIAEEEAARKAKYPEALIQSRDNIVRVPLQKHRDITGDYMRKTIQPDGRETSLREYLQDKDFETRQKIGLEMLKKHGVLK